ncbi:Rieske (2Fe-2S) protein [Candidatus Laterigemmans baculatus]|uniref:Rieske (2Fe-2S) protein n=1 Tax=Candidatus Laterigemmans baculatus TaxID=2770505 RepID=UPI001F478B72|nr:Rieske (2Fe-2S) protein [Candidatus Laterigemmans baculatus]
MQPTSRDPSASGEAAQPPRWVPVAASDELREDVGIERAVEGQLLALFRHGGQVYAIEALCAHHGGPLAEGQVVGGCVTCPWHGWQYQLADGVHTGSGTPLIGSYPAREVEGRIEVQI